MPCTKLGVTTYQDVQGKVAILYKGNEFPYTIFQKQKRQAEVVIAKQVDRVIPNHSNTHKPAPTYPWRIPLSLLRAIRGHFCLA
jgi:hypothetical protein